MTLQTYNLTEMEELSRETHRAYTEPSDETHYKLQKTICLHSRIRMWAFSTEDEWEANNGKDPRALIPTIGDSNHVHAMKNLSNGIQEV